MKIILTALLFLLPVFSSSAAEKCDFIKFNKCLSCDTPVAVGVRWNTSLCQRFCPNERHLFLENCVLNK